jgi:hypothetical protein
MKGETLQEMQRPWDWNELGISRSIEKTGWLEEGGDRANLCSVLGVIRSLDFILCVMRILRRVLSRV